MAKGIWRKELTYAKNVSEQSLKEKLIKLLTWYAALKTNYTQPLGKFGKYLKKFIEPKIWNKFAKTYADANFENMWDALFIICEIFNDVALKISEHYGYEYNAQEYRDVVEYLHEVRRLCKG